MPHITKLITSQDSFTTPLTLRTNDLASISVSGTWAGKVVVQRQLSEMTTWEDVASPDGSIGWSSNIQTTYIADDATLLRIGCRSGDFGSGTINVRLGTERAQPWRTWNVGSAGLPCFGTGGFTALGGVAALLLALFLTSPTQAQVLECSSVSGRGYVCPPVNVTMRAGFSLKPSTITGLGSCAASRQGTLASVSNGADSRTPVDAVSATGSAKVVVYCDGSAWRYVF